MLDRIYLVCAGDEGLDPVQANATAARLLLEDVSIKAVYCGPHLGSLETLTPIVHRLDGEAQEGALRARVEFGFRDWQSIEEARWLCKDQCAYIPPPDDARIRRDFDFVDTAYDSQDMQHRKNPKFEFLEGMIFRVAFALDHTLRTHNRANDAEAILICATGPILTVISFILTKKDFVVNEVDNRDMPYLWTKHLDRNCFDLAEWEIFEPRYDFAPFTISRLDRRTIDPEHSVWEMPINGNRDHVQGPAAGLVFWRFQDSIWRNRRAPNPVKIVFDFFRGLRDMHWPRVDHMMIKMQVSEWIWSLRSYFNGNPYRVPWWMYLLLFTCLLMALVWNMYLMYEEKDARILPAFPLIVQFALFLFPPLIAADLARR